MATSTTGTTGAKGASVEAVLGALRQHPDATAAELAEFAGIGRSTASRTLANLETAGRVARQRGKSEAGGRAAPDRWTLVPDRAESEPEQPPVTEEEPAAEPADTADPARQDDHDHGGQAAPPAIATTDPADADADAATATVEATQPGGEDTQPTGTDTSSNPRLRPGALRALVHDWLAARPGQEFTPTRIGKELGRSAGAVGNALATMTDAGEVTQTSTKPRTYTVSSQPGGAAETKAATETAKAS